jgi:hypothetical protein
MKTSKDSKESAFSEMPSQYLRAIASLHSGDHQFAMFALDKLLANVHTLTHHILDKFLLQLGKKIWVVLQSALISHSQLQRVHLR